MPKVTISEIARRAGVSKTAVSFAFNNPSRLSDATAKNILAIAEELGFVPNPVARSMSTGRTGAIGVLVPQPLPEVFRNPFLPAFLEGVGEICTRAKLSLMLAPPVEGSMRRAIDNAAVDGFLTLGLEEFKSTMVVLRRRGVPYVTVDSDPIEGAPAVNVDDEGGARAVLRHVLAAGHREIALIAIRSGKQAHYREYVGTLRNRINGYLSALAECGATIDGRKVRLLEAPSTEQGGYDAMVRIMKGARKSTAVVAMSDIIAVGAMRAALERGLQLPADMSFAGFDDIPLSAWARPPLTTVAQPTCKKGQLAAELLLQTLEGNTAAPHHLLPAELVVRASVAALR
jgi:DNA-binding LacI/PurR family transcriptional regulator